MRRRRCAAARESARESARERVRSVPHVAHRTTSPPHLFPRLIASHYGLNLSGGAPFAPPLTPPPQRLPCRTRLPQAPAVLAQVRLIGDQQLVHILPRILVNLGQPPLDVVERLHVGDVVHDDDAVGAAVIGAANRAETLLARRIPDLKLYRLPVKLYGPDLEVDANGGDVAVCPLVILGERGRDSACCRKGRATRREQQTPPMAVERERRTAKRSSKHDFPTPESPMSTRMKR